MRPELITLKPPIVTLPHSRKLFLAGRKREEWIFNDPLHPIILAFKGVILDDLQNFPNLTHIPLPSNKQPTPRTNNHVLSVITHFIKNYSM